MTTIPAPLCLTDPQTDDIPATSGAKAVHVQRLFRHGFPVPPTVFLPPEMSAAFVERTGLGQSISALMAALDQELRWEEIWDLSLRLRHALLHHPMPEDLAQSILHAIQTHLPDTPLAVRSCAPGEDAGFSHAGMHDSVLHVRGTAEILAAIQQVWASLWTDRALIYRKELGLCPTAPGMGVLIQPMVVGQVSGVLFTANPTDETVAVIEAAPGLARDVVEDRAAIQRILVSRATGQVLEPTDPAALLLSSDTIHELSTLGRNVEALLGVPQDMEWTLGPAGIVILQTRPITTLAQSPNPTGWEAEDKRPWYLSLTRSHQNLLALRQRIEGEIVPVMAAENARLKAVDLNAMDADRLKAEIQHRREVFQHWQNIYWQELIPFAHAVRQLGMLYNDTIHPEDPFEFTGLLVGQDLLALQRNQRLEELAAMLRADPDLTRQVEAGNMADGPFVQGLAAFMEDFGDLTCATSWCEEGPRGIVQLLIRLAQNPAPPRRTLSKAEREARFLAVLPPEKRALGAEVLELARLSYRLRDDDNLYLGKLQARYQEAIAQARAMGMDGDLQEASLRQPAPHPTPARDHLKGWPAAAGIARGPARVIRDDGELFAFQPGEILVCDALDPRMTVVTPLAAGIVERRGGMLVHGAIIAREYGIPCVTGVDHATEAISTGQMLVVDGFRGEVVVESRP
jgi:phosphoenolpyruvate synthase/pyruvate phosphate dikinase